MPVFSKTLTGLTPDADVVLFWRPSSGDSSSTRYLDDSVRASGTYYVSFEYPYDIEYTWSLYYGHYGSATTKIDGGTAYTASPPPPSYSITSITYSRVKISVWNLTVGDNVEMFVYDDFGDEVYYEDKSATASTMDLLINRPGHGFKHSVVVFVNGSSLGTQYFELPSPKQTYASSSVGKSVTFTVYNIDVGDKIALFFREKSDDMAVEKSYTRLSSSDPSSYSWTEEVEWDVAYVYSIRVMYPDGDYVFLVEGFSFIIPAPQVVYAITRTTSSSVTVVVENLKSGSTARLQVVGASRSDSGTAGQSGSVTLIVDNLEAGTEYIARVYVDESIIDYGVQFYTLFDWWISTVKQGAEIAMYNKTSLAPVTAQEWNRLVGLVNTMCNKAISTVSAGEEMVGGSGGNVRLVADALGVSVASRDRITAQFFLDLKDRINDML